jgi:hypothetical protein
VVKGHGKKKRARQRAQRTGAPYTAAAAGTVHGHIEPDTDFIDGLLPYVDGWESDVVLATKLLSACWAGCVPCQKSLGKKAVADRATLAALAGGVFLMMPTAMGAAAAKSPLIGPGARAWIERAHGTGFTAAAEPALRAVAELTPEAAADLLAAALDFWAASGADRAAFLGR